MARKDPREYGENDPNLFAEQYEGTRYGTDIERNFQNDFGGSRREAQDFIGRNGPGDLGRLYGGALTNTPGGTATGGTPAPPPGQIIDQEPRPKPVPGDTGNPNPNPNPNPKPLPPTGNPNGPSEPGGPSGPGGPRDDTQQRLIDQLTGKIQQGYQPLTQQPQAGLGEEVVRLMRLSEERNAAEAQKRAAFEQALRESLLDLMRRGQEPINTEETPESRAFARVNERAMQQFRAQQAEQRAVQGIGQNQQGEVSGALGSDIAGGQEQLAEKIAAFESRLVADQINRRREQLMQALQLGAGMLSNDQQTAIRRELASLDVAARREMSHADLGLREFLGGGQLSLGLLSALQQNSQFYDRLGYDVGLSEAMLNQNALNPLFGGYQLR